MKIRIALLMWLLSVAWVNVSAKFVQEVELKDGTILVGFVYKQCPGKSIVFHADRAKKDPKLKFRQTDKDYTLNWEEVKYIRKANGSERPWSYDRLTMNDGVAYTGEIIEQELGVSITLQLYDTGKKVTVDASDLKTSEKIAANMNTDLWLDRSYTNRLIMTDNTCHEGLIVLQYRGLKTTDCYVELLRSSGHRVRLYLPDIKEYVIILR